MSILAFGWTRTNFMTGKTSRLRTFRVTTNSNSSLSEKTCTNTKKQLTKLRQLFFYLTISSAWLRASAIRVITFGSSRW